MKMTSDAVAADDSAPTIALIDAREYDIAIDPNLPKVYPLQNYYDVDNRTFPSHSSDPDSIEDIKVDVENLSQLWRDIQAIDRKLRVDILRQFLQLFEANCILRELNGFKASEESDFFLVLTVEETLELVDDGASWKSSTPIREVEEIHLPSSVCPELLLKADQEWSILWIDRDFDSDRERLRDHIG